MCLQLNNYFAASLLGVILVTLVLLFPIPSHAGAPDLEFGMSTVFIAGTVNPQDAKAGLKLWMDEMVASDDAFNHITPHYLDNFEDVITVLESKKLDFIFLPTPYYVRLKDRYYLEPTAVTSGASGIDQQYMLLVNKKQGLYTLKDLGGKHLTIMGEREHGIVGKEWLRALLNSKGLPAQEVFFSTEEEESRASRVIIQLFFNKIDVGLVTKYAYDVMVELNPQIQERLQVVAVSPPILSHIMCYTEKISSSMKNIVRSSIFRIREYPRGQQICTLFKLSRLLPYTPSMLDSSMKLFIPTSHERPY